MLEVFKEKERITVPDCIGYKALVVTATGEEVLQWLEELILQEELRLPDKNGADCVAAYQHEIGDEIATSKCLKVRIPKCNEEPPEWWLRRF